MAIKKARAKPKRVLPRSAAGGARRKKAAQSGHARASSSRPFVVGIGASAGGLEALQAFFDRVPTDSGMAFVVVTHLRPDRPTLLPELLARRTRVPVQVAAEGGAIEADRVYVSPPGVQLGVLGGKFQWMKAAATHAPCLPIDYFFRTLADDQAERAICIVLSGTGSDGTLGLRAIKAHGGMVMVQDASTAHYAGMPHSATATLLADFVLAPGDMPAQLQAFTQTAQLRAPSATRQRDLLEAALPKIFLLLRNRLGHDFSGYKQNAMQRRILRRMRVHELVQPSDYLSLLEAESQELDLLFQELLVTVTQFFRDAPAFDVLALQLAKCIEQTSQERPLRIWVPGCSTGEEAYSIAMLVTELLERAGKRLHFQIFATDLDSSAIELGRNGVYPAGVALDVGSERLRRFFIAKGTGYQICKPLRDHIVFATHNVLRDPPFAKLDLLSCRNLLIYLDAELQQQLFQLFHYALKPHAVLWLGSSENANAHSELFRVLDRQWKIYERRLSLASGGALLGMRARRSLQQAPAERRPSTPARNAGVAHTMESILLERFAPPTLVVSERGDIAFIHGRTGAYLELSTGEPRHNIFAMAREGLRASLQSAVRAAVTEDREIIHSGIAVRTHDGLESVTVTARRISEPESLRGLIRVSFMTAPAASAIKAHIPSKRSQRVNDELAQARDSLQGTLDELQNSNEELKSTNEELQSTNEELQSSNEELESSKEELESLNEELQTVNVELQLKIEELAQVNDDMQNMLNGTEIATLFLDSQLRIKRFTEQARRVIRLIASDVGRPIGDLVSQIRYEKLTEDAQRVLRTLIPQEIEVPTLDGHWLLVRMLPYRTGRNVIDGVAITFADIDRVKRAEALASSRALSESVVQTVREPLVVLDHDLHIVATNQAFAQLIGLEQTHLGHKALAELAADDMAFSHLAKLLRGVIAHGSTVEAFQLTDEFEFVDSRSFQLYSRRLVDVGPGTLGQILIALSAD